MSSEWKYVCKWCGKEVYLTNYGKPKWYHSNVGYWCWSQGTRRAPSPDYDASEKINEHKRGDSYSKPSDVACPKCMKPNMDASYYVFYNGPQFTVYGCSGCNSSFNKQMQDCTLYLAAEHEGGWNN